MKLCLNEALPESCHQTRGCERANLQQAHPLFLTPAQPRVPGSRLAPSSPTVIIRGRSHRTRDSMAKARKNRLKSTTKFSRPARPRGSPATQKKAARRKFTPPKKPAAPDRWVYAFGGGKAHTLVALWHLARQPRVLRTSPSCAGVRRVLGDLVPEAPRPVAVFTNRTCDATQGRHTPEGLHTRTAFDGT